MLDNIEDGIWRWLGPNWDSISEEGKDLIKHMMDPDPKTRWTIDQCLDSKWIVCFFSTGFFYNARRVMLPKLS